MLLLRLKCTRNFCLISIMFSIIFLKNVFFLFYKNCYCYIKYATFKIKSAQEDSA